MHDEDAVGEHGGQIEVVQDGDDAAAALGEIARHVHDDQLVLDVEAGHRLVEKQVARLAVEHRRPDLAKHARKLHALLLAARKLLVEAAGETFEVDARQRPLRQTLVLAGQRAGAPAGQAEPDDLAHGERKGQRRRLRQHRAHRRRLPRLSSTRGRGRS